MKDKTSHCPLPTKVIRPYLSSAFVDLQDEISYLHTNSFKKLDLLSQEFGGFFQIVDSRRTSVDFRSTHDFVLTHALDRIRRCQPYFMCVIGSHYGQYCRKSELPIAHENIEMGDFQAASAMKRNIITAAGHGHSWVKDEPHALASMLELEIEYAALHRGSSAARTHCYFYLHDRYKILLTERPVSSKRPGTFVKTHSIQPVREVESDEAQKKLLALKNRLISGGFNVRFFTNQESLDEVIYDDWSRVIELAFGRKLPESLKNDPFYHHNSMVEDITSQTQSTFYLYPDLVKLESALFGSLESFAEAYYSVLVNGMKTDRKISAGDETLLGGDKLGDGIFSTAKEFVKDMLRHDECEQRETSESGGSNRIFALVGGSGVGKSTLLYHWVQEFKKEYPSIAMIYHDCACFNNNLTDMLLRIIREIRELYWGRSSPNLELCEGSESFERICQIFTNCIELLPCIIVIDGLDQIGTWWNTEVKAVKELCWIPRVIPATCRFVVSTRKADLTYKSLKSRADVEIHKFPRMNGAERQVILQKHACPGVRNYLTARNVSKICNNHLSEEPLVIASIVSLIEICRNQKSADLVVDKVTNFRNPREFWKGVFTVLSKRLSWSRQSSGQPGSLKSRANIKGWVGDALKLIITSRRGLRRKAILQMLTLLGYRGKSTVTPNDWEIFMSACRPSVQKTSAGYIFIAHRDVKESLGYWLLGLGVYSNRSEQRQQKYHSFIASYLENFMPMQRQLDEVTWQLMKAQDWSKLCQILCQPRHFLHVCMRARMDVLYLREILRYWKLLEKNGFDVVQCFKQMTSGVEKSRCQEARKICRVISKSTFRDEASPASWSRYGSNNNNKNQFSNNQHMVCEVEVQRCGIEDGKSKHSKMMTIRDEVAPSNLSRFDETASAIRDYQTDLESDVDFSDTDSSLHNFSEYNSENIELFCIGGWTPIEDGNPNEEEDQTLDDTDLAKLKYFSTWFLYKNGKKFLGAVKGLLADCKSFISKSAPLTPWQSIIKLYNTDLECHLAYGTKRDVLEEVTVSCGSVLLTTAELSYEQTRNAKIARGNVLLCYVDLLLQENRLQEAHKILMHCYGEFEMVGSVDGYARVTCVLGQLTSKQGTSSAARLLLERSLRTLIEWHGRQHVKVAFVLTALGDHYCRIIYLSKENNRRALISYKEALRIYEYNEDTLTSTKILAVMGKLLDMEGTLNSKEEALKCFGRAKDLINIKTDNPTLQRITSLNKDFKKTAADVMVGRYEYGKKPQEDLRSEERPYSAFSYHQSELKRLLSCTPRIPPETFLSALADDDGCTPEALKAVPSQAPPYSPYSIYRIGKEMVVCTKRSRVIGKTKQQEALPLPPKSATQRIAEEDEAAAEVVVRLPVKIEVDANQQFDNEDRTQARPSRVVSARAKTAPSKLRKRDDLEHKNRITRLARPGCRTAGRHRQYCDSPDGPHRALRQFHGPHSSLNAVYKNPNAPRPNVKAIGIIHKSAWYHVPGRYIKAGEHYAPKRNQLPKTWRSASSPKTDITIRSIFDNGKPADRATVAGKN